MSRSDNEQVPVLKTAQFPVTGMECAACAVRIERKLARLSGVEHATVNYATNEAQVKHMRHIGSTDLVRTVQKAGYGVSWRTMVMHLRPNEQGLSPENIKGRLTPFVDTVKADIHQDVLTVQWVDGLIKADLPERLFPEYDTSDRSDDNVGDGHDRTALRVRLIVAAVLTIPVFVLSMWGSHSTGMHVLLFVLATPVVWFSGQSFFVGAGASSTARCVKHEYAGGLRCWQCLGYSTIATFAPDLFAMSPQVYFEAAAVIVTLVLLGRLLEANVTARTGSAIQELLALQVPTARVRRQGYVEQIPVASVKVGDHVIIPPGEKVRLTALCWKEHLRSMKACSPVSHCR